MMKEILYAALAVLGATACSAPNEEVNLSRMLCHSEMARHTNPMTLDFQTKPKWDYSAATELLGMLTIAEKYNDTTIYKYVTQWVDTMVLADGRILGYKGDRYNIDHVCPGLMLLHLHEKTQDPRLMTACDSLWGQMKTHPRTSEGGFWHKKVYPHQMWLDGLYMGAPFLARYAKECGIAEAAQDLARQYIIVGRHTYDDSTHLYRHAWDESHEMFWADKETGRSQHAWGRANGWYMMGMVEALENIPVGTPGRDSVMTILQGLAKTVLDYADPETGMWYQVLDSPQREGNYVESSCSAMFIYSMLKGARLGLLPAEYREIGREKFQRFVARFVKKETNESGETMLSLTDCCAVAGLGGKDMRDGTFDYYVKEQIRDNDPKTVGPFLLACAEMDM